MARLDVWSWVILPAMTGDRSRVERRLVELDAREDVAPARRDALAARALLAVGAVGIGMARARRALGAGDGEAAALARVALPDGELLAARGIAEGRPGEAADAACDQAWRRLLRGDRSGAESSLVVALQICPDHAEAQRWWGLLAESGPQLLAWLAHPEAAPLAAQADLEALVPTARQGWLSWERQHRRPHGHVLPEGLTGGLARLVEAGVWGRHLADDATYAALEADDPRVVVELALDEAWTRRRSGRAVGPQMRVLWEAAQALEVHAQQAVAAALVALGLSDPSGTETGLAASAALAMACPEEPRWAAAQARMLATAGAPSAAQAAARVLTHPRLDRFSWQLALETLQRTGSRRALVLAARRALCVPDLAPTAAAFLRDAARGDEGGVRAG